MENEEYLRPRIRVVLGSIGFCEKYQAFEYLVEEIFYMCVHKDLSKTNYKEIINNLSKQKNIEPICVSGQLGSMIISNKKICDELNLNKLGNYKRIKTLSNFVEEKIKIMFVN